MSNGENTRFSISSFPFSSFVSLTFEFFLVAVTHFLVFRALAFLVLVTGVNFLIASLLDQCSFSKQCRCFVLSQVPYQAAYQF